MLPKQSLPPQARVPPGRAVHAGGLCLCSSEFIRQSNVAVLFAYAKEGGGGIRQTNPAEAPAVLPFVHVENTQEAFDAAVREGAEAVAEPEKVMEGVTTAIVRAPGGILISFSGP